ncbi:helix-turn-helix domain-containing protein [Prevotella falsenii]|uniref:helix-turn-helix domain-containing protein n=1 Tax=Prevotella falsenii TaxID=515414 RepID=UPI00046A8FCA|nr:helix-turn-helix domain-containing protein [Prevotella falsenii]
MKKVLKVNSVNDYAEYIGAETMHPLVSIIHYDELKHCRHSLNNYGVYGLFLMEESPYTLAYGQGIYQSGNHSMLCVAPGQMGGVSDTGEEISLKGWALLFSPLLIAGTPLERQMENYHFFSYYQSEALRMQPDEWRTIVTCMKMIRYELQAHRDAPHRRNILVTYLQLILEYCSRFYERQFHAETVGNNNDLLKRFNKLLHLYYKENRQLKHGVPTVKYCAQELFLSPNYFGDLVRQLTGDTAIYTIRKFVMQRAQVLLTEGLTVAETASALGFDYPQHFSRQFKAHFGVSPKNLLQNE